MTRKLTQSMIDSVVREIEEPLITTDELADALGITRNAVNNIVHVLKIETSYKIKINRGYVNAYTEEQARRIIEYRRKIGGVVRVNKLDISKL